MKWKVAGALIVLLTILTVAVGGWWWLRRQGRPEHFVERAQRFAAEQQTENALQEYKRALWAAKTNAVKIPILIDMADMLMTSPPAPVDQALNRYYTAVGAWRSVLKFQADHRQTAEKLLQATYDIATVDGSTQAWQQARDDAERILAGEAGHPLALACRARGTLAIEAAAGLDVAELSRIRDTLHNALAANPDNLDLVNAVAQTYLRQAALSRDGTPAREDAIAALCEQAQTLLDTFADEHPDSADARLAALRLTLQRARLLEDAAVISEAHQRITVLSETLSADTPMATRVAATVLRTELHEPWDESQPRVIDRTAILGRTEQALRDMLADSPNDLDVLLALAGNLNTQEKWEQAAHTYGRIRDQRIVPVGKEALRTHRVQVLAAFYQTQLLFRQLKSDMPRDLRETVMAEIRDLMATLDKGGASANAHLQILRGQLAYHEEKHREAVATIAAAQKRLPQPDPDGLLTAGLALATLGEIGAAGEMLGKYLDNPARTRQGAMRAGILITRFALSLGDMKNALRLSSEMLALEPENPELVLLRARVLMGRMQQREETLPTTEVEESLVTLLTPLLQAGNAEAVRLLTDVYQMNGAYDDARAILQDYIRGNPDDAGALVALARVERAADRPEAAKQAFEQLAARDLDNHAARHLTAELQRQTPRLERLERLAPLALETDAFREQIGLYAFFIGIDEHQEAAAALERAATLRPDHPRLWHIRVSQAMLRNNLATVENLLNQAADYAISTWDVSLWRAQAAMAQKRYNRAQSILEDLLQGYPLYSDARVALGDVHRENGRLADAEAQYRQALQIKPDHTDALMRMFRVADQRNQPARALAYLGRALIHAPSDALMSQYLSYAELHNQEAALRLRQRLAAGDPDPEQRRAIARLFAELDSPDRATQVLDELIAEEGKTTDNLLAQARVYRRSGRADEARTLLENHLRTLAENAAAEDWMGYARFLREMNDDEAVPAYRNALALTQEDDDRVLRELGDYYTQRGRYPEALEVLKQARERNPRAETWRRIVGVLVSLGRYEEAGEELAALKKQHAEKSLNVALLEAGKALGEGNLDIARGAADQAVELAPADPRAYLARAQVLMASSNAEERQRAGDDLNKVLEMRPGSLQARQMLVRWLQLQGATTEAILRLQEMTADYPGRPAFKLDLASLYLAEGRHAVLGEALGRWRLQHPEVAEWDWFEGNLQLARGNPAAACEPLAAFVQARKNETTLETYVRALLSAGRADNAARQLEANSTLVADSALLQAAAAAATMQAGESEHGRAAFGKLIDTLEPTNAPAIPLILNHMQASLPAADAEALYRKLAERTGHPQAWQTWINTLLQLDRGDEAAEQLEAYLRTHDLDARAALLQAQVERTRNNPAQALQAVETAIQLAPNDPTAYLFRARLNIDDRTQAVQQQVKRDIDQALALAPASVRAQDLLVDWLINQNRIVEAIQELQRFVGMNPAAMQQKQRLAQLYLSSGRLDDLERDLTTWEGQEPNASGLLQVRGRLLRARGQWERAATVFSTVFDQQPNAQTLAEWTDALIHAGQPQEAAQTLNSHEERVRSSAALLAIQGRALTALKQTDEAANAFRAALTLATDQGTPLQGIIDAVRQALDPHDLIALLQTTAEHDDSGQLRYTIARTYMDLGQPANAVTTLEKLQAQQSARGTPNMAVRFTLASAYSDDGRHDQAIAILQNLVDDNPDNPTLLNALAYELVSHSDRIEEALTHAQKAVRLGRQQTDALPHYLDTLGLAQHLAERHEEARATLVRALAMKDFPACRIHLAQVSLALGNPEAAKKHLEAADKLAEETNDAGILEKISALKNQLAKLDTENQP